jgi:hypothetical protein
MSRSLDRLQINRELSDFEGSEKIPDKDVEMRRNLLFVLPLSTRSVPALGYQSTNELRSLRHVHSFVGCQTRYELELKELKWHDVQ